MKNLSDVPVQLTISNFVNNLTNFEDLVKNVWQYELISPFNINVPSLPRWRYYIGLLLRIDWQNSLSTTYGSSFFERRSSFFE